MSTSGIPNKDQPQPVHDDRPDWESDIHVEENWTSNEPDDRFEIDWFTALHNDGVTFEDAIDGVVHYQQGPDASHIAISFDFAVAEDDEIHAQARVHPARPTGNGYYHADTDVTLATAVLTIRPRDPAVADRIRDLIRRRKAARATQ